jgi:hypothetical protein
VEQRPSRGARLTLFGPLIERGLNVVSVLPMDEATSVVPRLSRHAGYTHVILVGSTGGDMWRSLRALGYAGEHPVDEHAADAVEEFRRSVGHRTFVAWPSLDPGPEPEPPMPVTKLGELAGWGRRSPLGIGMHPRHGLWVGYRAVILVDGEWDEVREQPAAHACDACPDKPCISVCPGSAIGSGKGIDAGPCFVERLRDGAPCNDRCASRLACPEGVESRYPEAQINHHQHYGNRIHHRWRREVGGS